MQESKQVVVFQLQGEEYAVDIKIVNEVIETPKIKPIPQSEEYVEGIVNLRDKVVPIINLGKALNLPGNGNSKVIVVETHGKTVGLIVDAVSEILEVEGKNISPPVKWTNIDANYAEGIIKLDNRLIIILIPEAIIPEKTASIS